jgi:hypothetical protein
MTRAWYVRFILIAVTGLALFALMAPPPFTTTDRVVTVWWDFLHVPAFGLITASMLWLCRTRRVPTIVVLIVLVPVLEALQQYTGRDVSGFDVLLGWAGVAIGLLGWLRIHMKAGWIVFLPLSVVLFAVLWHPVRTTIDRVQIRAAFPVLAGFDTRWVPSRWQVTDCTIEMEPSGWRARVNADGGYPGLFLADLVRDWQRAEGLSVEIDVEGVDPTATIWIRVDDRNDAPYHDRYQEVVVTGEGHHRILIPRSRFGVTTGGRAMDLTRVQTAGIFFTGAQSGAVIRLHRIELLPSSP